MALLDLDARWRRFNNPDRRCPCCDQRFHGVFDIGFDHPADWPHEARDDQPFVKQGEDQLTADLCRAGAARYIRVVMSFPLQGSDNEQLHITPWAELAPEAFYAYLDSFDGRDAPAIDDAPAHLANQLPGFDSDDDLLTPVLLHFPSSDARPIALAQDGPLAAAQQNGISFDQLLDIYAAFGQDVRPHLQRD